MLSFSVGPFALSLNHLLLLVALALATLVGWISGRKQRINPERAVFGLFMFGLLVARLAFVARYWPQYESDPLRIVDIRDGGFSTWPGVIAVAWRPFSAARVCSWTTCCSMTGVIWADMPDQPPCPRRCFTARTADNRTGIRANCPAPA
jgi:prolipoprotein diacylglyceryltransferase